MAIIFSRPAVKVDSKFPVARTLAFPEKFDTVHHTHTPELLDGTSVRVLYGEFYGRARLFRGKLVNENMDKCLMRLFGRYDI